MAGFQLSQGEPGVSTVRRQKSKLRINGNQQLRSPENWAVGPAQPLKLQLGIYMGYSGTLRVFKNKGACINTYASARET